jgi:hypothetical protein
MFSVTISDISAYLSQKIYTDGLVKTYETPSGLKRVDFNAIFLVKERDVSKCRRRIEHFAEKTA